MLPTRSARLAVGLLLALLLGWTVRWQRLRHSPPVPAPKPLPAEVFQQSPENSFPDE